MGQSRKGIDPVCVISGPVLVITESRKGINSPVLVVVPCPYRSVPFSLRYFFLGPVKNRSRIDPQSLGVTRSNTNGALDSSSPLITKNLVFFSH